MLDDLRECLEKGSLLCDGFHAFGKLFDFRAGNVDWIVFQKLPQFLQIALTAVVTVHGNKFMGYVKTLCILPIEYVCVLHMVLIVSSDFFS